MNRSEFRPVKHLKMTVCASVLWKMNIGIAKKWPEMVVTLSFISIFHFRSGYITYLQMHMVRQWHYQQCRYLTVLSTLMTLFLHRCKIARFYISFIFCIISHRTIAFQKHYVNARNLCISSPIYKSIWLFHILYNFAHNMIKYPDA